MILIPCPHCGPRNSNEFTYSGESRSRPDASSADPASWRAYLYMRNNPAGWTTEGWFHASGCRRFFVAERHTETNEFRATYLPARADGRATAASDIPGEAS